MPVNRPVVFKIRSLDVIHSFFVPDFSEKIDAVPGITTTLRVTATRMGSYPAECTELCGAGHGLMRAAVRVVSDAQFNTWMAAQKPNGARPSARRPPTAPARDPRLAEGGLRQRGLVGLGHQPAPGGLDRRRSAAERLVSGRAGAPTIDGAAHV